MFTLKNFTDEIDSVIIDRGYDYYSEGMVKKLSCSSDGVWKAFVAGNEEYSVSVRIKDDDITEWDCTCLYDRGPVCKHTVSVLLAIRYAPANQSREIKDKKTAWVDQVKDIINHLSAGELRKFITILCNENKDVKNSLLITYSEKVKGDPFTKYSTLVKSIFESAASENGLFNYFDASVIMGSFSDLNEKAHQMLIRNNITESLLISMAIIEKIPEIEISTDNQDGEIRILWEQAFDNLFGIIQKATPDIKDILFNFCINEYPKSKYYEVGVENSFLDLFPMLANTREQEKTLFNLIDEQITVVKKKDDSDYALVNLIKAKIDYFERNERDAEANELLSQHSHLSEFRNVLIDRAIIRNDFDEATKLCINGIDLAEKKHHTGTCTHFKKRLLEIAERTQNIPQIQHWAEFLFFHEDYDMKYFRLLKKSWTADTWQNKCDKIIDQIKNPKATGGILNAQALANVFSEEGFLDRLLTLLKINIQHFQFIDANAHYLINKYPAELIGLYETGIRNMADATGRSSYKAVVQYLKKAAKIQGGIFVVNKLVTEFREKYRNRKAMMEILDKDFK
jgi:hypothetical protein